MKLLTFKHFIHSGRCEPPSYTEIPLSTRQLSTPPSLPLLLSLLKVRLETYTCFRVVLSKHKDACEFLHVLNNYVMKRELSHASGIAPRVVRWAPGLSVQSMCHAAIVQCMSDGIE